MIETVNTQKNNIRTQNAAAVKAYRQHADKIIDRYNQEVKALNTLKDVCRQFDGKVVNKRFHDAIEGKTGFHSLYTASLFKMYVCGVCDDVCCRPYISISLGKINHNDLSPHCWPWRTGDRMDAAKAVTIIDTLMKYRLADIEVLEAAKKSYSEYLRKARAAESLIKELKNYNIDQIIWAKDHDLNKCLLPSLFWE